MTELIETGPADPAVSAATLAAHLRLATGFAEASGEDALLERYVAAATARIEARLAMALVARPFEWRVACWDPDGRTVLPVGPVTAVGPLLVEGPSGTVTTLAPADLAVAPGRSRQRLARAGGGALPAIPPGGRAVLTLTAGFGTAGDIPADLAQAVLMLAGHLYEARDGAGEGPLPPGVAALIAPHAPVRLAGARA